MEPPIVHHHAVQFYGNDESLFTTVASFLSEGLIAGQPAIIIATEAHRAAITHQLGARLIDVEKARREGDLILLDADDMLGMFMVGDVPGPHAFENNVGRFIEQALSNRTISVVRAYGEMVDVLWKQGREDAAIRLEILWNTLASRYHFALLCGYSMGSFYKKAEKFQQICDQHTHVQVPDTKVVAFERRRAVKSA